MLSKVMVSFSSMDEDEEEVGGRCVSRYSNEHFPVQVSPEREKVVREIIETEKRYRDWLRVVVDDFIKPVSEVSSRKVITKAFLNVERLLQISEELYKALKDRMKSSMLENSNDSVGNNNGNNNNISGAQSPLCSPSTSPSTTTTTVANEDKKNGVSAMSSTRIADVFLPFIPRIISEYSYFNHHYQKARDFLSSKLQQPTLPFSAAFKV